LVEVRGQLSAVRNRVERLKTSITASTKELRAIADPDGPTVLLRQIADEQRLEKAIRESQEALDRARQEAEDLDRMLAQAKDGKVPLPVLRVGRSRVSIKSHLKVLPPRHVVDYLLHLNEARGLSWQEMTWLAPSNAVDATQKPPKVKPMDALVTKVLVDRQAANKQFVDGAHGTDASRAWTPPQKSAWAWMSLIQAFNHVWGAVGAVPLPKGVRSDRRLDNRAKREGGFVPPALALELKKLQDQVAWLTRTTVGDQSKSPAGSKAGSTSSQSGKASPSKVATLLKAYEEALLPLKNDDITSRAKAVLTLEACESIASSVGEAQFPTRTLSVEEAFTLLSSDGELVKEAARTILRAQQTASENPERALQEHADRTRRSIADGVNADLRAEIEAQASARAEEQAKFDAADKVGHTGCTTLEQACSSFCPKYEQLQDEAYGPVPEDVIDELFGPAVDRAPEGAAEFEEGSSGLRNPSPDVIPDFVEVKGIIFTRIDLVQAEIEGGAHDWRNHASLIVMRDGMMYISLDVRLELPNADTASVNLHGEKSPFEVDSGRKPVPAFRARQRSEPSQPAKPNKEKMAQRPVPPPPKPVSSPKGKGKADPSPSAKSPEKSGPPPNKGKGAAKAPSTPVPAPGRKPQGPKTLFGHTKEEWAAIQARKGLGEGVPITEEAMADALAQWEAACEAAPKEALGHRRTARVDPLTKENPLGAKGVPKPRTAALTGDQKQALRSFFEIPEERIDPDTWASLNKQERTDARAAMSIPRWATAAVVSDPSNLDLILKGELTKDSKVRQRQVPGDPSCGEQWRVLKGKFAGEVLLDKPLTPRQKAFKKAFDHLATRFPNNPALPKVKKTSGSPGDGTKPKNNGKGSSGGSKEPETNLDSTFDTMLKNMERKMKMDMLKSMSSMF
jgi:hypothetical protein